MEHNFDVPPVSRPDPYSRRQFITGLGGSALAAVVLAACGRDSGAERGARAAPAPSTSGAGADTRLIKHPMGETEIPARPERVVVLSDVLGAMLTLGVRPVGARNLSREQRMNPEMAAQHEGIFDMGGQDLDIEQIIRLAPDLIMDDSPGDDDLYGRLSRVAPTILYDRPAFDHDAQWEKYFSYLGDVLGKQDRSRQLLADWDARIAHFRSRIAERGLGDTMVSAVSTSRNDELGFATKGGFVGSVLEKAGLRRPPSQDLDAQQTEDLTGNEATDSYKVWLERVRDADGDVIFLWGNPSSAPMHDNSQTEATEANTAALKANPLWRQLNAVQKGRVYEVGGYWRGGGSIVEANKILDDLYRGVLEEDQPQWR